MQLIQLTVLLIAACHYVTGQVVIDWDLIAKYEKTTAAKARLVSKETSSLPYAAMHLSHEDTPWMGDMQLISVDPLTGLFMWRLRSSPGYQAGIHRHYGEVYALTEEGCWGYVEHPEWLACKGDVVHETPGSVHTYYIPANQTGDTTIMIMTWGALENLDENGNTEFIADWRTMVRMYEAYCEASALDCPDPVRARNKQDAPVQKPCPVAP